jgi:MFS family permease
MKRQRGREEEGGEEEESQSKSYYSLPSVGSLLFTNLTYALIQFNIASLFVYMLVDFPSEGISGLGELTSAFFLGIGLFEIPGSILSGKLGTRRVVLLGTILSGLAMLLSGFVEDSFSLIVFLRFLGGLGTGMGFPSLVVLLARSFRSGREGFAVGLVNVSYNAGGMVGLFGWALIGLLIGWRESLIASGGALLLAAALCFAFLPKALLDFERDEQFEFNVREFRRVLFNRWIGVISLSLFGIGGSAALTWNFVVFYLEEKLGQSPGVAGLVGSFANLFSLLGALFVGRAYDARGKEASKRKEMEKKLLTAGAITMTLGVSVTAIASIYAAIASTVLVGIATSLGWTVGLAAAKEACAKRNPKFESVAIALVDCVSLFGSFVSPIVFPLLVVSRGYPLAWLLGSSFALVFSIPLMIMGVNEVKSSGMVEAESLRSKEAK